MMSTPHLTTEQKNDTQTTYIKIEKRISVSIHEWVYYTNIDRYKIITQGDLKTIFNTIVLVKKKV